MVIKKDLTKMEGNDYLLMGCWYNPSINIRKISETVMKIINRPKPLFIFLLLLLIIHPLSAQDNFRIVSCTPNWTHSVAALGSTDDLVAVTRYCIFPDSIPNLVKKGTLETIGGFVDINKSKIMKLNPDVILTSSGIQEKLRDYFVDQGIKVIHMDLISLEEVYSKILELGIAINKERNAKQLITNIRDGLQQFRLQYKDVPKIKVYYEINYFYKCVPGKNDYMTEIIKMVGGDPIFSDRPGVAPRVTWEEVVEANPDVILLPLWENAGGPYFEGKRVGYGTTTPYEVAHREGAQKINAVKNGKVRYINSAKTKQAGPQIPTAADLFGKAIHADGDLELLKIDKVPENMETLISFLVPFINSINVCYSHTVGTVSN